MGCGAYVGRHATDGYAEREDDAELVRALETDGILERMPDASRQPQRWIMTETGFGNFISSACYVSPSPLFVLRHGNLALTDRTNYELVRMLELDSWELEEWRPVKQRRKNHPLIPLGYLPGAPKIWYNTPLRVSRPYLLLLNQAEVFFAQGLESVPHAADDTTYNHILSGNFVEGLPAILDIDVPPDSPLAIEDELLNDELMKALEEELQSGEDAVGGDEDACGGDAVTPACPAIPEALPPAAPAPASPVVPSPPPAPSPATPEALPPAAPAPAPAAVSAALGVADIVRALRAKKVGAFQITPRQADIRPPFGGWQAACPFHKLNDKSGCKKWFGLEGSSDADKTKLVRRILWWCACASDYSRQRKHVCYESPTEDVQDDAFVLAMLPQDRPPPKSIKTDVELDDADVAVAVAPAAAVKGKGRGRARGHGGRGRKGRGKGDAIEAAGPNSNSSSSSSSSSSDSSSSD